MNLYPSLEDMKVDQLGKAQNLLVNEMLSQQSMAPVHNPTMAPPTYPLSPLQNQPKESDLSHLYPALNDYMGLEFTHELLAANMPEYLPKSHAGTVAVPQESAVAVPQSGLQYGMIAPISGSSLGLQRAQVTHGIRQLILCKGSDGKVGLRVKDINKGVFVCLVKKNSPAALAGLRFGDQILQINEVTVAGYSMEKVHKLFKKSENNGINIAVRDRPFERLVTLHKDSSGQVGFHFKDGEIDTLVKDSSAARNGLLTEHQILEINGQNVVGLKDKEIIAMIREFSGAITVTIMPSFLYKHMIKHMASSLTKYMDHSVPDL